MFEREFFSPIIDTKSFNAYSKMLVENKYFGKMFVEGALKKLVGNRANKNNIKLSRSE